MSRVSAKSPSMTRIEKELREATKRAASNFKPGAIGNLLIAKKPINMRVTFLVSHFADVAELLPKAKRVDGLTIEYTAENMVEAYKTFELLALAASGMSALLTQLS